MRTISLLLVGLLCISCAKNPSVNSIQPKYWQAKQAADALGALQRTAISLNKIQRCDPLPCAPLLSENNTRIVVMVVGSTLRVLLNTPEGWRQVSLQAITEVENQLGASAQLKLSTYLQMARSVIEAIQ